MLDFIILFFSSKYSNMAKYPENFLKNLFYLYSVLFLKALWETHTHNTHQKDGEAYQGYKMNQ